MNNLIICLGYVIPFLYFQLSYAFISKLPITYIAYGCAKLLINYEQLSKGNAYYYKCNCRHYMQLQTLQAGIKIAGENVNNLRYADDTTLTAESEELKSLLMKVKRRVKNLA